ncbi:Major Facilitator Superfamily protein [Pseudobythopirellula maris]|uniref:Major Facilitator Superfamily protein n=1 Tax=Pseudobythopirellula maris TaxID=2527991 RepID=A0A5C5ZM04_9BACT|nr:MFS transporter [Pseudobythopirellula maris]TWT88205.1 Major Facilitator Superfamily protein [Pseudobythopirellula maris]
MADDAQKQRLFWGCWLALITTAFGFISRMLLISDWSAEFNLDPAQAGRLAGIGIWPFALSIIVFSLFIDRIGYKTAMVVSFLGYMAWSGMAVGAYFVSAGGQGDPDLGFKLLYWGSLILGLSNGTVEAYINPVVATMFNKEKTKWLNILHAGWPGGLVLGGLITIGLGMLPESVVGPDGVPWWIKIAIIAPPALIFFLMLAPLKFPVQERVASGVSYREMLAEFGVLGAAIVGFLVTLQLMDFFSDGGVNPLTVTAKYAFIGIGVAIVVTFGLYTQSLGNKLLFVLALIMMPLATTELGTDAWISTLMEGIADDAGFHPALVLIYTSAIMMVLRFFAGSIVHVVSPIGLLIIGSLLAIGGLYSLSFTSTAVMIFVAATLYAIGKSFFWPTMLGVAAEQTPKGGALTLNALGGIGMLAVGTLGLPYIGTLKAAKEIEAVAQRDDLLAVIPAMSADGVAAVLDDKRVYEVIPYQAIDEEKLAAALVGAPEGEADALSDEIAAVRTASNQGALASMCIFPAVMLAAYALLGLYFKSRGGYQAQHIGEAVPAGAEA